MRLKKRPYRPSASVRHGYVFFYKHSACGGRIDYRGRVGICSRCRARVIARRSSARSR